jgi:fumarate reductase flavoprotein subunit
MIEPFERVVRRNGGEIILDTPVTELILEHGRITGVRALSANGVSYTVMANKGVILATGGYGANPEFLQKYNSNIPVTLSASAAGLTGDGIILAQKVGAALEGMEYIQPHPHGMPKTGNTNSLLAGGDTTDVVFINREGKRFIDENERRDTLSMATLRQPGGVMFSVYDTGYVERVTMPGRTLNPVEAAVTSGEALRGTTLEELARVMGVDVSVFIKTINDYNDTVQNGTPIAFPKATYDHTISEAPFYAIPLTPTIHYCMGGVRINAQAQVLNERNQPIPGLYAAGEVTGGVHGSNRVGGCSLTDALVYGRIAGTGIMK